MKKPKKVKLNDTLQDFQKFAGIIKESAEQGDKENRESYSEADPEAKAALPGGKHVEGETTNPLNENNNEGKFPNRVSGTTSPKIEEKKTKEQSASAKIANDEGSKLIGDLMESIKKVAGVEGVEHKANTSKEASGQVDEDRLAENKEASDQVDEDRSAENKEASSQVDEDRLAEKIANHFRNVSVGHELGNFLFSSLAKSANEEVPVAEGADGNVPAEGEAPLEDQLAVILQAVQELVAEGQISEQDAQAFLIELQQSIGGAEGAQGDKASLEDQLAVILQAVQELVAEGQITEEQAKNFLAELDQSLGGGGEEKAANAEELPQEVSDIIAALQELVEEGEITEEQAQAFLVELEQSLAGKAKEANEIPQEIPQELAEIITALQELIAEGEITEEQAHGFLAQLEQAMAEGGAEGAPVDEVPVDEVPAEGDPKVASAEGREIFSSEQLEAIENEVNRKVANWTAEGKSEAEIQDLIKEAAANDAALIKEAALDQKAKDIAEYIMGKVAMAQEREGVSDKEAQEYIQWAQENPELIASEMDSLIELNDKIASWREQGYSDDQIQEHLHNVAMAQEEFAQRASQ